MANRTLEGRIAQLFQEQERRAETLRTLLAEKKALEREFQGEVDRIVGRLLRQCPELRAVIQDKIRAVTSARERELLLRAGLIAIETGAPDALKVVGKPAK
jgi:hypothetical protein